MYGQLLLKLIFFLTCFRLKSWLFCEFALFGLLLGNLNGCVWLLELLLFFSGDISSPLHASSESKIADLNARVLIYEDVGRLEVSVDDIPAVEVLETALKKLYPHRI